VDPENSDAASRGCAQMEAFVRRHGYSSSVIIFNEDWTSYRRRVEQASQDLLRDVQPGDNLLFYCIGYDCTSALRELVNQLPRGSRLVCVFDCCYVTEKPAFRIHHSQRGGPGRSATAMAPLTDQPMADVLLFEGMAEIRCVAWFKSAKGNTPLYTAGFIRALSKGPDGYWGRPSTTSFIQLSEDIDTEMSTIVHRLPKDALPKMTSLISCTRPYSVDQQFLL